MISLRIPEILAMPERNRAERRRKARACRAIVRSGYFRKHGDIANAAPALHDAATRIPIWRAILGGRGFRA